MPEINGFIEYGKKLKQLGLLFQNPKTNLSDLLANVRLTGGGKAGESVNIGAMHRLWYVGCSYTFFEGLDAGVMCEITPAAKWFAKLDKAIKTWNSQNS